MGLIQITFFLFKMGETFGVIFSNLCFFFGSLLGTLQPILTLKTPRCFMVFPYIYIWSTFLS